MITKISFFLTFLEPLSGPLKYHPETNPQGRISGYMYAGISKGHDPREFDSLPSVLKNALKK